MLDLSIIIVSYNTKEFLKNSIKSVYETVKNLEYEIIVVDNNSTDGTVEEIQSGSSTRLKIIRNKKNLGFSKANNLGVKKVIGEYILFLNSDTIVYEKTLETMVEFMKNNKSAGAATCKVLMPNRQLDDASHRGFPTPWNALCHFSNLSKLGKFKITNGYNLSWMDFSSTHEIDACAGAFMIVRKEAGDQINWWDEDYFWYGDDLDFCYRLKKAGWKIYYVPTVSILHYKGVSGGIKSHSQNLTTADLATKRLASKARFEAMRIFYRKHYQKAYPRFLTWLVYKGIDLRELTS